MSGNQPNEKPSSAARASLTLNGVLTGVSGLLIWAALMMAASLLRALLYLLLGVGNYEDPRRLTVHAVLFAPFFVGTAYLMCHLRAVTSGIGPATASTHFRKIVAFELRTLGLARQRLGRLLLLVMIGVGSGLSAALTAQVLAARFSWNVPATDPRDVINHAAPAWSAAVFGLVAPAPVEEAAFRGSLLFAAAGLAYLQQKAVVSTRVSVALQLVALVATSLLFGRFHLEFSVFNAVVASIGGLIWGSAALWGRSIVPALLGHGVYDMIAIGGQAGG